MAMKTIKRKGLNEGKGSQKKGPLGNKYLHCVVLPRRYQSWVVGCSFMNVAIGFVQLRSSLSLSHCRKWVSAHITIGQSREGARRARHPCTHKNIPHRPHMQGIFYALSSGQWEFGPRAHHFSHIDQLLFGIVSACDLSWVL